MGRRLSSWGTDDVKEVVKAGSVLQGQKGKSCRGEVGLLLLLLFAENKSEGHGLAV